MVNYQGLKTLEVLEGADNYNAWIASSISPYIKSPALEIGAGTGNISNFFKTIGKLVISDNDPALVNLLEKKYKNKGVLIRELDIEKKGSINLSQVFKTIYSVNVLEHIKNDILALRNMRSMLDKGGNIVLLVPAKKFAYTKLDKNLGHFRRYEKSELKQKLEKAGFFVEKIEYFNFVGIFSWMLRNLLSRNHNELNTSHVKTFDIIVPLFRLLEPKKRLPIGISLIAVGRKV